MFRLRINKKEYDFEDQESLFDWVRNNYRVGDLKLKNPRRGVTFAVLEFNRKELISMDRYRFDGSRFVEAESTTR